MQHPERPGRRPGKWRIWVFSILVLVLAGFIFRLQLERVLIAVTIRNEHIFHPPEAVGFREAARFYWDVSDLRVSRERRLKQFNPRLRPLVREITRRQAEREGMQYSMHIYREIRWLLNFTDDTAATSARIADLRASLADSADQRRATQQLAEDGSWGLGINAWYLRLYYTVEDGLDGLRTGPMYRLAFLDRINSPTKLRARLDSALRDDFTRTREFNREELDETFSALARLLHRSMPTGYIWDPGVDTALRGFVRDWQNPETGCWGQWMIDRDGKIWKMDDMAMTFHVVSDFHGAVDHLDKISRRVLALGDLDFPAGVKFDGQYANHLNWDVVKILRYAWPQLDSATRTAARARLHDMLDWCLAKSYRPDGSFAISELDDTYGDAIFYGVAFLVDAGYFDRHNRFWTDADFAGSQLVHQKLLERLHATGLQDPELKDAYQLLTKTQ